MPGSFQEFGVAVREDGVRGRLSNRRWLALALLATGTMINYLDRTAMGIAGPSLSREFSLSPGAMGVLLSVFSWSYAAGQIPGGVLLDKLGARLTYFFSVTFWSLFTLLHGLATNLYGLLGARFGLGVCEAPCFPTNNGVVTAWFPRHERARATAVYTVGEYVGLACFGPALFWITSHAGWRAMFISVGAVGLLFGLVWWRVYRDPSAEDSRERVAPASPFSWMQMRELLRARQVCGVCLGQFGGNSTLVFFLTWFPTYLATERHMTSIRAGELSVLPFLAGGLGVTFGGLLSDYLLRRTGSLNLARKLPVIAGLLGASTIAGAGFATSDAAMIAILSGAFFGQGMTGLGWAVISDIAPESHLGLTGGIFSLAANVAGIVTPMVIGFIVGRTGSFHFALAYVGAIALIGAAGYIFVLGDVKPVTMRGRPGEM
jgi:ACS family D-galactonate transporter-like MFS transporter